METSVKITFIIVSTVLVLALVGGLVYWNSSNPANTLTVNGQAQVKATPDLVSVYFNVETHGANAVIAKDNNTAVVGRVTDNLIAAGFKKEEITTENFNIYEDFVWENNAQKSKGYKAVHTLKIKLDAEKMDRIGTVIDAGVNGGAMISYINFELSQSKENEYKALALKAASEDAKIKADAMASGLGKRVAGTVSISSSEFGYYPWRVYDNTATMVAGASEAKAATTDIQPGEREVNAQVSVVFKIK